MKKYIPLLLTAWGIISTLAALYFLNAYHIQKNTNILFSESIALHKKAIANEAQSYNAINDCFVINRGLCDADEFKNTLQSLGDEADEIYNEISLLEREIK